MAKKEQKFQTTQRLSEGQIKSEGMNRWLRRRIKRQGLLFIICIAWAFAVDYLFEPSIQTKWISVAPLVFLSLISAVTAYKAGNIFLEKVKKLQEPIDLDSVK